MRRPAAFALFLLAFVAGTPVHADGERVLVLVGRARRAAIEEALRIELAGRSVEVVSDEAPEGDDSVERARLVMQRAAEHGAAQAVWIEPPAIAGTLPSVSALDTVSGQVRYAALPRPSTQVGPRVFAVVAASLLDELAREAPPPIEPEPEPEPAAAPAPAPAPAVVVVPQPTPAAAAPGVRATVGGTPGVGIDFFPMVGTSLRTGGRGTRWLSLNALGGLHSRLRGLEMSGLFGIVREDVVGIQMAGMANIGVGNVRGVQLAGMFDFAGGRLDGIQLAGSVAIVGGDVDGGQLGGLGALARGDLDGVQAAGLGTFAGGDVEGVQLAGLGTFAGGDMQGAQLAGLGTFAGGDVEGVQVTGLINVAMGDVRGAQIGVVNIAGGDVEGLQLGVVNVSSRTTVPVGVVNVMRKGSIGFESTIADSGMLTAALLHGTGPLHVQYRAGGRVFGGDALLALGFGLGATIPIDQQFFAIADLSGDHLVPATDFGALGVMATARLGAGYRVSRRLSVVAAATWSVLLTDVPEGGHIGADGIGVFAGESSSTETTRVLSFPGLSVGLRVE